MLETCRCHYHLDPWPECRHSVSDEKQAARLAYLMNGLEKLLAWKPEYLK